jgi:predicted amidohydrolase
MHRIGIAQYLATPGAPDRNLVVAVGHIASLAGQGCQLIVLPELWPCGFAWDTLGHDARGAAEPIDGPRTAALADASRAAGAWVLAGTVPEAADGRVYNTALLFAPDGSLHATHRKARLYTPLDEHVHFAAGNGVTVTTIPGLGVVGIATCFDGDFPEVARALRRAGARVVLHPAAYELAAEVWWDRLYPANALANGQWWISVNQCGTNASGTILGASRVLDPFGAVVAEAVRAAPGESPAPQELVVEVAIEAGIARWDAECAALFARA